MIDNVKQKILLWTHSLLGDFICSEPIIRAFYKKYNDEFTVDVFTHFPSFFKNYPYIDNIVVSKSKMLDYSKTYKLICDGNGDLVKKVAKLNNIELSESLVPEFFLLDLPWKIELPTQPYVVISAEANYKDRMWEDGKWKTVIDELKKKYKVVQVGVKDRFFNNVDLYLKKVDFVDLAHLIKNSSHFITVDSGLSHFSASIKKKYIVLMNNIPVEWRTHQGYTNAISVKRNINNIVPDDVLNLLETYELD